MNPLERYQHDLASGKILQDSAQAVAVEKLNDLYLRMLAAERASASKPWLAKAVSRFRQAEIEPVKGLYFWGGVGRGKTYLMDMFYDALPLEKKQRSHFHRFMRAVHHALRDLQGKKNPLDKVADQIAERAHIICFDEFFVSDITDAMILAGLFEALFQRGVALVATSNIEPQYLYKDGLQRQRFLPAIDLIQRHTEVVNLDGGQDYRLRTLKQARLFYTPIDSSTEGALMQAFQQLAPTAENCLTAARKNVVLDIESRSIVAKLLFDDVAWFEFQELCDGPRSQNDYIEIAREFHSVIISDVPTLGVDKEDVARRFILLVDEFYDHRVKLVVSSHAALLDLYKGAHQQFEFQRTLSRLQEMQSLEYLAEAHRGW